MNRCVYTYIYIYIYVCMYIEWTGSAPSPLTCSAASLPPP